MGFLGKLFQKFHAGCKQDPRLEDPSRLVLVLMDPRWCTMGPGIHAVQIRIVPGLQRFSRPRIRSLVLFYLFFRFFWCFLDGPINAPG